MDTAIHTELTNDRAMTTTDIAAPNIPVSEQLFADALTLFPGGVNSPARAFRSVGGTPRFIARGEGAYLVDADGHRYVDYVLAFGPHLLGHAAPGVVSAVRDAAERGFSYGAPTEAESVLAHLVQQFVPSIEKLRFVSSGTEAVMSAVRVARAYTDRQLLLTFDGNYHGHAPLAPAIVAPYNDLGAVAAALESHQGEVAAILVEAVSGNMGVVLPAEGFLAGLRELATAHGALLIFDEVMTGFRVHPGGAQALHGIRPDLTTLGKVIGGGLPVGAYGGRRDVMGLVAPDGPVYQAGTLSGNPVAMAAGIAMLSALARPGVWQAAADAAATLARGLDHAAREAGIPAYIPQVGTMLSLFFNDAPVTNFSTARASDSARFATFFHAMLARGVYLPPSQLEAWFTSTAHGPEQLEHTVAAAAEVFHTLR
jgi:glutamate-1-semialdehyde 2,1-aminomutase